MTLKSITPFPELHALDEKRRMPSLSELLGNTPGLPLAGTRTPDRAAPRPSLAGLDRLPQTPAAQPAPAPAAKTPRPLEEMPVGSSSTVAAQVSASMDEEDHGEFAMPMPPQLEPGSPRPRSSSRPSGSQKRERNSSTDEDLKDALLPVLETTLAKALYAPETGIHTYLEPMLRSTVRRAIAEQMDSARQFSQVGPVDRLAWRLSALFSSRSYDEVVFDRTRRFQVEEVYLVRKGDFGLISYASHDPARHGSSRRIQSTLRMLVRRLKEETEAVTTSFELPEKRVALVRNGKHCLLLAILRGSSNALVRADLDYVLRQAEERFGDRLERSSEAFLRILQPILEGCLLIQSPAPPR